MVRFLLVLGLLLILLTFLLVQPAPPPQAPLKTHSAIRLVSTDQHPTSDLPEEGQWPIKLPTPLPVGTPCPDCTLPSRPQESMFQWNWPRTMRKQDEGIVTFSIVTMESMDLPTMSAEPDQGSGTETPNFPLPERAPLARAFGPGYKAVATATLEAPSFNKTPSVDSARALDSGEAKWEWIITPQGEGTKLLTVRLKVDWTGDDKRHPPRTREWSKTFKSEVTSPVVTLGTFQILPWVTGISGTTLLGLVAWIIGKRKKMRARKVSGCFHFEGDRAEPMNQFLM